MHLRTEFQNTDRLDETERTELKEEMDNRTIGKDFSTLFLIIDGITKQKINTKSQTLATEKNN